MRLAPETFDRLRVRIQNLCGLAIGADKEYLVRDRLEPLLKRRAWNTFEQLAERLELARDTGLADEVVEAIVTHETSFFRDPQVWEALRRRVLPELLAQGRRARIWSAATSTGQEAYSLAMLAQEVAEAQPAPGAMAERCSILATDISDPAIQVGMTAAYEPREIDRGVSAARKNRFFHESGKHWRADESLRRMIEFRRLNLAAPLPRFGAFDLICCRNLMIYYSVETRRALCEQFHASLADGGWLLLGAAENLYGISDRFESEMIEGALMFHKA
ncbi:MAG: protein-glutamate O-methyltransferase CheR [Planctomycetia bacterium]|nr:protein-glutamate O-methyltransferase CheR [Planctomycetia bacterium]